jgi:hypothetical protein
MQHSSLFALPWRRHRQSAVMPARLLAITCSPNRLHQANCQGVMAVWARRQDLNLHLPAPIIPSVTYGQMVEKRALYPLSYVAVS